MFRLRAYSSSEDLEDNELWRAERKRWTWILYLAKLTFNSESEIETCSDEEGFISHRPSPKLLQKDMC